MSLAVFGAVLGANLAIIGVAGTDIPFQDQWDAEGRELLPAWQTDSLSGRDLFAAHNEHRIFWTRALDIVLLAGNGGRWDPLVELVADALLRAILAGGFAWWLVHRSQSARERIGWGSAVALGFTPLIAWHNALWGFQSQVLFAVGFGSMAIACLARGAPSRGRIAGGLVLGVAGLLAMGPAALVPLALLGVEALRTAEKGVIRWRNIGPTLALGAIAWALWPSGATTNLTAADAVEFFSALGRALAWPHTAQPWAALVMNAPLAVIVVLRLVRLRPASEGEDVVIGLGFWAIAIALAAAWKRGSSPEWTAGVPSRYGDFLVLLPLANGWCAAALARAALERRWVKIALGAWLVFVVVGWLALAAEMTRQVILPRARDREAPVRLMREFQETGDGSVFAGQPRLLVPHPRLETVRGVLADPRLHGVLPPSLQPDAPMGPLSRFVRWLLRR